MPQPPSPLSALWSATTSLQSYPTLTHDLHVDVAIVGGGITGLTTAYHLVHAGLRVAVLEAFRIGMGTTGSSTGNLYVPVDEHLSTVASKHDEATLRAVATCRKAALDFIAHRMEEFHIACAFERVPWFLFADPHSQQTSQAVDERQAANRAGLSASGSVPDQFPYEVGAMAQLADQAQFNPLQYVQGLAAALADHENCLIFENTQVTQVEDKGPCVVQTAGGQVKAQSVVMATHTPKGIYGVHTAMECYREAAMAVRLKGDLPAGGIYWHLQQQKHYSVRPYRDATGDYLIAIGEPHLPGHDDDESFQTLETYLRAHFAVDQVAYRWAAQKYQPADTLPYIGVSPLQKHVYIATGFSADGLIWGTAAGHLLCDAILQRENPYARYFDPKRFTPVASAPRLLKEGMVVAQHLVSDYLFYGDAKALEEVRPGEGKTLKLDGEKVAAYRDEAGRLYVVSSVCPHMGCIVHWNAVEKSWDCPCHGSRFAVDGQVLEGPAYHPLAPKSPHVPSSQA
ncbi:Glycine/D-amino acid oxidase [Catalinimonas alkaloidigena]|uniref:Glycine/D-amino acid oxidase n=1 Tax=Catalinimonas alkaloidigena TaxID=1075417 RepID=A0A1G8XFQ3_9BACT|nr:FAD-dependent oxidoreductase [Catalinimonas alkaloidigena]SDJ89408.1 Glycine/D-amino acid oxidase [Catalinimonas alkaloidigena]